MLLLLYSVLKLLIFLYNSLLDVKYIQSALALADPASAGLHTRRLKNIKFYIFFSLFLPLPPPKKKLNV